jgi:hypothetical protein
LRGADACGVRNLGGLYRNAFLKNIISEWSPLLANRDARTKVKFLRIRIWKVRAQIGPVMPKITGQTV